MLSWDAEADGNPKVYTIDGYTLTLASRDVDGDARPAVHVKAPTGEEGDLIGVSGFPQISALFGIGHLDAAKTTEQVILSSYSGGAHCCTDIRVLALGDGGWKTIELGSWDGGGIAGFPTDIDGNGYADFVFSDNRFAYAFTDYADSRMPPMIYEIRGGAAVDVSDSGRYRALFEKDMQETQAACEDHNNGGCAAYAADAARLGMFDMAWDAVLKNYDPKSDWDYPAKCNVERTDGVCPDNAETKFANFPEALMWFLEDTGYIKPK
jgi:hypothetical protein